MDASEACVALGRWLTLRRQALPLQEVLPGLRPPVAFDACVGFWQGEDLCVHALLADPSPNPDEVAHRAEALRAALETRSPQVPGRILACVHCITATVARAEVLRRAVLDHADGHFLSKVLVGRSVICLQDGGADYTGRGEVQPSAAELVAILSQDEAIPDDQEAAAWQDRRWRE